MSDTPKPVFTQKLHMHVNGGSEWSQLLFHVYRDGNPTGIRHSRRTNGSSKYLITEDVFFTGDEFFDALESQGAGLQAWLEAHSE